MSAWLRPTWRATRWGPLLAVTGAGLVAALCCRLSDQGPPEPIVTLTQALLVVAGVAALHDPARQLLQPVSVAAWRRLLRRLALVAPVTVLALATLQAAWAVGSAHHVAGPAPAQLAALGAVGVAASAGFVRRIGAEGADLAAGVLGALIIVQPMLSAAWLSAGLLRLWADWPIAVVVAATVATALTTAMGVEA